MSQTFQNCATKRSLNNFHQKNIHLPLFTQPQRLISNPPIPRVGGKAFATFTIVDFEDNLFIFI